MAENNHSGIYRIAPFIFLWVLLPFSISGQTDTSRVNKKRLNTIVIAGGAGYAAGLIALNHVWYKDTERHSFRFFNDNAEWKQLDKLGHFYNSFYLSYGTSKVLQWCDVETRKAHIIGAVTGFMLTVPIEVMDGFSDGYGASAGDLVADAAGPAFFLGQQLIWNEIRIIPKYSFHRTAFAPLRPELLGDNLFSEILKDYNGQTQWLSVDVDKFTAFPKWLNIAFGYGAHGMIYARDDQNHAANYYPYRQYYVAIDFDLSAIRTRSKLIKTLMFVASAIKLPSPTLEFSKNGSRFHPFYF